MATRSYCAKVFFGIIYTVRFFVSELATFDMPDEEPAASAPPHTTGGGGAAGDGGGVPPPLQDVPAQQVGQHPPLCAQPPPQPVGPPVIQQLGPQSR